MPRSHSTIPHLYPIHCNASAVIAVEIKTHNESFENQTIYTFTLDKAHLVTVAKVLKMYGRAPRVLAQTGGGSTSSKIGPGYYTPQEPKHRAGMLSPFFLALFKHTIDV